MTRGDIISSNKVTEEVLLRKIDSIEKTGLADACALDVARAYLQTGFLWLNNAVEQPGRMSEECFAASRNVT